MAASIVIDFDTGKVLEDEQSEALRHPASMTKIMTLMLTFDALREGRLHMDSRIPISSHAASREPSKLNLRPGSTIAVADAIPAISVHSANDIATAMAEELGGGSEQAFAAQMTARAHAIGMTRTTYVNASGLPDSRQITTAHDMALLCEHLIRDYPEFYHYFSQPDFKYGRNTYTNHNRLMNGYAFTVGRGSHAVKTVVPPYPGMDGLKTGFTDASGSNLAASAVRFGRRLIAVVFGGQSPIARDMKMANLLDAAFTKPPPPKPAQKSPDTDIRNAALPAKEPAPATMPPPPTPPNLPWAVTPASLSDALPQSRLTPVVPAFGQAAPGPT